MKDTNKYDRARWALLILVVVGLYFFRGLRGTIEILKSVFFITMFMVGVCFLVVVVAVIVWLLWRAGIALIRKIFNRLGISSWWVRSGLSRRSASLWARVDPTTTTSYKVFVGPNSIWRKNHNQTSLQRRSR